MHNNYHNEPIEREQYREHKLDTMRRSLYFLLDTALGRVLGVALLALLVLGWTTRESICSHLAPGPLGGLLMALYPVLYPLMALAAIGLFLGALARPWYYDRIARDLIRAGIVNKAGEPPVLRRRCKSGNCSEWRFRARGIPLKRWLDNQTEIESALNVNIVEIREDKDRQTILLHTVPPSTALGENMMWEDGYTDKDEAVILLGRGLSGDVSVNLDKTPHILIGGSTGSGKSILLKVILLQALNHKHTIYIADFKGGVDFSRGWHQRCGIITGERAMLETLEKVIGEPIIAQKADSGEKIVSGDVFYRYRARSEKIKYAEMSRIVEERAAKEREGLMKLFEIIRKSETANLGIVNYNNGKITTPYGVDVAFDRKLVTQVLKRAKFIKEGSFHETEGLPVIKVTGNIDLVEEIPVPELDPDKDYPYIQKTLAEILGITTQDLYALVHYYKMKEAKKYSISVTVSRTGPPNYKFSNFALQFLQEKLIELKSNDDEFDEIRTHYRCRKG